MNNRVYLAGPDVFEEYPKARFDVLKQFLAWLNFEGVSPLDNDFTDSQKIFTSNVEAIMSCDYMLVNVKPFRGTEPDSGTVFEAGLGFALGKTMVGYHGSPKTYDEQVRSYLKLPDDSVRDHNGLLIEDFGHSYNLMLQHGIKNFAPLFIDACQLLKTLRQNRERRARL